MVDAYGGIFGWCRAYDSMISFREAYYLVLNEEKFDGD